MATVRKRSNEVVDPCSSGCLARHNSCRHPSRDADSRRLFGAGREAARSEAAVQVEAERFLSCMSKKMVLENVRDIEVGFIPTSHASAEPVKHMHPPHR